jgi:acyl-coenzyme A synthetase/AMP-(fatty) acid ligase
MSELPLIAHRDPESVFGYRRGAATSVRRFLRDAMQLAARLPNAEHIVNLCADRYRFAVGFAAALLEERITLLPPNHTPEFIGQVKRMHPDACCLIDAPEHANVPDAMVFPELDGQAGPAPAMPSIASERIAAIVFTSGSTAQPMPHPKTWRSLWQSSTAELTALDLAAGAGTALVATVPPQHMYGFESTVLLAMHGALSLVAERPFYPADICATLAALPPPRALVTTPVHLRALLCEPGTLPDVDRLVCATAPLSVQLAAEGEARFSAPLYEIYGCTEAGQLAVRRPVQGAEWRPYQGVRLREDEQGTWVSGGHVQTEILLNDVIELVAVDRFLLHGRHADMVNIAGKRTSLAYLTYQLNSIPGVRDGVFMMPDEEGAAAVPRLTAFVVAPGVNRDELIAALRKRIDPAFLPRPLNFVDALPRNSTGKLPRAAITALAAELAAKE